MERKIIILICSLAVFICFQPLKGYAIEGQVTTSGKISFRANQSEDSTGSSTTNSSTKNTNSSTSQNTTQSTLPETSGTNKSEGKLPNTGDLISDYRFIIGVCLGITLFLLFLRKRRRKEEEQ